MSIDFWNKRWFEKYAPLVAGLLSFFLLMIFRNSIETAFQTSEWKIGELYGVVFNWSSIQSGFVFAIYGFIVTKRDGFAGQIIGTQSYEQFIHFTKRACLGGFGLTIISMPIIVVSPDISEANNWFLPIALWFSLFMWAFCAFLRVAFSFGTIIAKPDKKVIIPG